MQLDMTPPEDDVPGEGVTSEDSIDPQGGEVTLFHDVEAGPAAAQNQSSPTDAKTEGRGTIAQRRGRRPSQNRKATPRATAKSDATASDPARLNPGDELEVRLARMQFFRGAYTRRGVNLERHFYPEPLLVTDLDLLSFEFSARLTLSKTIGEAKSGIGKNAPKPLDRAIWMAGLKQLVDADGGIVITALRPSPRVRETARALGVTAISIDDLERWEKGHLTEGLLDVGAHGPAAFTADTHARKTVKPEPELERIYWFLRSEVWFLDSWQATKRLIGALAVLRRYWTPDVEDNQAAALRWLYAEAISILTLNLVALTGRYQASDHREWPTIVGDRLAEGPIPAVNQRALANAFDKYLAHILGELRAPATMSVETMGAFHPTPPEWSTALIELLDRLEAFPGLVDLPRHTDLTIVERLVRRRHVSAEAYNAVSSRQPDGFARVRRQIAAFLRGVVDLPEAVDKAITS